MTIDDPRLTAYALDELGDADRAQVEAFLAQNADARRFVDETRQTAAMLAGGLRSIDPPVLTTEQRATVEQAARADTGRPLTYGRLPGARRSLVVRWSLATAACAALVAGGYAMLAQRINRP